MLFGSLRWKLATVAVAGVIASGGGVASETPDAILGSVKTAVDQLRSVHVAGALKSGSTRFTLDLDLTAGKGGEGSMSENNLGFKIVLLGRTVYLDADSAFWSHFGGKAAAELFAGRWLSMPASGQFASLASFLNVHTLFSMMFDNSNDSKVVKGGTSTVDGQAVIALEDPTGHGTLYVASKGAPYPIEIVDTGADSGQLAFSRFDQPVSLKAPAGAINLTQLK